MSSQHIDWWALAAWFGINIGIPVIAPLIVLWFFQQTEYNVGDGLTVLMEQEAKLKAAAEQATKIDKQAMIERIKQCLVKTKGNGIHCLEGIK